MIAVGLLALFLQVGNPVVEPNQEVLVLHVTRWPASGLGRSFKPEGWRLNSEQSSDVLRTISALKYDPRNREVRMVSTSGSILQVLPVAGTNWDKVYDRVRQAYQNQVGSTKRVEIRDHLQE